MGRSTQACEPYDPVSMTHEGSAGLSGPTGPMNLSERLDKAKRKRDDGAAPSVSTDPAVNLRMRVEDRTYDGTDLRDGKEMTEDRWEQRKAALDGHPLPVWGATAEDEEDLWQLDLTGETPVVDLEDGDTPTD